MIAVMVSRDAVGCLPVVAGSRVVVVDWSRRLRWGMNRCCHRCNNWRRDRCVVSRMGRTRMSGTFKVLLFGRRWWLDNVFFFCFLQVVVYILRFFKYFDIQKKICISVSANGRQVKHVVKWTVLKFMNKLTCLDAGQTHCTFSDVQTHTTWEIKQFLPLKLTFFKINWYKSRKWNLTEWKLNNKLRERKKKRYGRLGIYEGVG